MGRGSGGAGRQSTSAAKKDKGNRQTRESKKMRPAPDIKANPPDAQQSIHDRQAAVLQGQIAAVHVRGNG